MRDRAGQPLCSDVASTGAPAPAPRPLRLNITSDPANLALVRHACEDYCQRCGLSSAATADVGLCVNEAMANITRHAYAGAHDKPVELNGWCDAGGVHVSIRDWGSGELPEPREKRDPLTPGGLGMVCLRQLMDDIVYTPQPDGMLLTMTKRKH
jgi:anti-sigma regulatory factor (Ser/Thr protein kinase)